MPGNPFRWFLWGFINGISKFSNFTQPPSLFTHETIKTGLCYRKNQWNQEFMRGKNLFLLFCTATDFHKVTYDLYFFLNLVHQILSSKNIVLRMTSSTTGSRLFSRSNIFLWFITIISLQMWGYDQRPERYVCLKVLSHEIL